MNKSPRFEIGIGTTKLDAGVKIPAKRVVPHPGFNTGSLENVSNNKLGENYYKIEFSNFRILQ